MATALGLRRTRFRKDSIFKRYKWHQPLENYAVCRMVPQGRIELPTSPLPRVRSTTELLRPTQ